MATNNIQKTNFGRRKRLWSSQEPAHPLANSGPESLSPGHSAPLPRLTQATPASVAKLLRFVLDLPINWVCIFQPQRHRPGAYARPGLDHQSPHSLGGEATKTSPWGGHQQEVQVGRRFHRGKLHEYSDSTWKTFLQGNCGSMVMVKLILATNWKMLPLHNCPGLLEPWKARISDTFLKLHFRSLFSGAKRWFGTNKGSPSGGTSVVYSREAPELQVGRK